MNTTDFIKLALEEDVQDGDHTSLATIPNETTGKAHLLVKEEGVIAGIDLAKEIFEYIDPSITFQQFIKDGDHIKPGDIAFIIEGSAQSILKGERLMLNCMQRMSGIATQTNKIVNIVSDLPVKLLDTRKTTPLLRELEKYAVKMGGGYNHRFGLYDMIMIKDNHIDYAGGIKQAIEKTQRYLQQHNLNLKVEIETRDLNELNEVLDAGNIHRIMLDNYSYEDLRKAVKRIDGNYETEASGGITIETIREYALCGVDYISVGALTHSVKSLDLSLKAIE